uniref:Radial spoke head 3 n=1 Tax=Poecilia latipinna TaxID=48699 RepID=A0A3B3URQ9_9TELE
GTSASTDWQKCVEPNGMFTYSSHPKPVEIRKYRDLPNPSQLQYGNIMYDRRVVRGNLHDQQVTSKNNQSDPGMQQAYRRRAIARKQAKEQLKPRLLKQYMAGNIEIDCQTDEFLDKPSTPLFVPAKLGVDVEMQIEEGDLIDFDLEVQPVLEVLVGKTIEQSLLEVMEEEELACLRTQQRVFQELQNNELAEVQHLEEQERRDREEKEHRVAQQKEVLKKEQETQYLAGLLSAVFSSLRKHSYFYDPVEKDISVNFLPWLMTEVNNQLDKRYPAREVLDNIIYEVTEKRLEEFKHLKSGQNCCDS